MVFYMLFISAELENLTNLQPLGGCDDPNYRYYFKVKCENCGEISLKETCVTLSETVPLSSGRATANLVQKCKLCGREGSIQMVTGQGQPLTLEQSQAERFSPLMVFDCRGFEPIGFSFGNGWKAESGFASLMLLFLQCRPDFFLRGKTLYHPKTRRSLLSMCRWIILFNFLKRTTILMITDHIYIGVLAVLCYVSNAICTPCVLHSIVDGRRKCAIDLFY